MKKTINVLIILSLFSGCATGPRKRFIIGFGGGAAVGALGGAALSPNLESKGMNALVFGLTGALLGGITALILKDDSELPEVKPSLKNRELTGGDQEFIFNKTKSDESLPSFVKERLKPAIIEEYEEKSSIAEDGGLRAPHKVWRIKYPAQLVSDPVKKISAVEASEKK